MRDVGEILVEMGVIDHKVLEMAQIEAKTTSMSLEDVLVLGFFVPESALVKATALAIGIPHVDLEQEGVEAELVKKFGLQDVSRFINWGAVPVRMEGSKVRVAVARPSLDVRIQIEKFMRKMGFEVEFVVAPRSQIERFINDFFTTGAHEAVIDRYLQEALLQEKQGVPVNTAVPMLLDALLTEAVFSRATDMHLVCESFSVREFLRIDGVLRYIRSIPQKLWFRISSAVKQRAGMDPGDRVHVQDGHFVFSPASGLRTVNIRVSSIPTADEGESIVMRILDEGRISFRLPALGFYEKDLEKVYRILERPHGLILVTGPTGSGKTTTLYAIIQHLKPYERSTLTIEDPVEYHLPFVRQVQVNRKAGRIPASILRAFLRHDPDVILVGEIRDRETADIAMQAAETGHLVLSTLHTNDAPSAVIRLKDMGIDPISIASTLRLVVAQRLVRVLCPHCKTTRPITDWERRYVLESGLEPPAVVPQESGCRLCSYQGYVGRTVVYELVLMEESDYERLRAAKTTADVVEIAESKGYEPMRRCGLRKVFEGLTTVKEVMRVCG
ncbi:MAG: GspE/PulE family protein [Thermofilaceae archaeon]